MGDKSINESLFIHTNSQLFCRFEKRRGTITEKTLYTHLLQKLFTW